MIRSQDVLNPATLMINSNGDSIMKTFKISFVTVSTQTAWFTKEVEAGSANDARLEVMAEAQIPARFVRKVELVL